MTGENDDKLNQDFSLEEILAEYREKKPEGARPQPVAPPAAGKEPPAVPPPDREKRPAGAGKVERQRAVEREAPKPPPEPEEPEEPGDGEDDGKIIPFPEEETPFSRLAEELRSKADRYAEHMFEKADEGRDPETRRIEELVPGVDREEEPPEEEEERLSRERKRRREEPPAPDVPPQELFRRYSKGLKGLRTRSALVLVLALLQLYLLLADSISALPLPPIPGFGPEVQVWTCAGGLLLAMVLGIDILGKGLAGLFRLRMGADTLASFACVATLADACTMPLIGMREGYLPYCALATLALYCSMHGELRRRCGLRLACRTAAAAKEPYLVTLDEGKWNGRDTYTKWQGEADGFGSQIQAPDGAQRIFGTAAPLLLIASLLFALISSVGRQAPEHILWCLSANLTACASLGGLLAFGRPFHALSRHLAKSGAALAGWPAARRSGRGSGVVLTDLDLFPPGTVSLNGIKVFGDWSVERVIGYTATVIRDSGSGLARIFHDLLRTQGAVYRETGDLCCYEGGGVSAVIRGRQVLVGSASFMTLMEVALPKGLSVKNAVFTAIDGELAGIFVLHYTLHPATAPSLDVLLRSGVKPVLATRDFNLIPAMLRQRFKLDTDRMEFPPVERRRELSDPDSPHSETLTAVLCREGLTPFADAVVGARRLRTAVRASAGLSCAGAVLGLLMSFYLTFVGAYAALSPFNLTAFALLWMVPTLLITGWVDRY